MTTTAMPTVQTVTTSPPKPTLQASNIQRVQSLVREFQNGNPAGYLEGVSSTIKGSVLAGLIPGGDSFGNKDDFMALMGKMEQYMEVTKFEPSNWHAVDDDVLFTVNWQFVWKETGATHDAIGLVRKVVKNDMICEKYHVVDAEAITGAPSPHDPANVKRVQALLAEFQNGNPAGYLEGVSSTIKGSVLAGLIPGGESVGNKDDFMGMMAKMDERMEVTRFAPREFRALPNDDIMFLVDWEFVWKPTSTPVQMTGVVRKVLKDNMICEKYHLVDANALKLESPRDIAAQ